MSRSACLRHKIEAPSTAAWLFYPPEAPNITIWIPRSVCEHRSQLEPPNQVKHPLTKITVADWWVEKNPQFDKYFS